MSQDVASNKQPLISSPLEINSAAATHTAASENQASSTASSSPQRKCGVHCLNEEQPANKGQQPHKKLSVDAVVEAYLDEHPAFLDNYVKRKVSRQQLEQWLFLPFEKANPRSLLASTSSTAFKRHHLVHSSDPNLIKTGGLLSCVRGQPDGGHERQRSRSFTPLRKLSATTFEAGGLATPILATTIDGQPSFLRSAAVASSGHPVLTAASESQRRQHHHEVAYNNANITNRKDLLLTLLPEILTTSSSDSDLASFAKGLMKSANLLMGQCSRVDLVLLLRYSPNSSTTIEGTTFTMKGDKLAKKSFSHEESSQSKNTMLHRVLASRPQILNINHAHALPDGDIADNALLGPLSRPEGSSDPMGCLMLYNKEGGFSSSDESLLQCLLTFTSISLSHLLMQQETRLELARSEVFLELARTVFQEPSKLEATMLIILTNFLSLIDCQRCQISLCDADRPAVFKRVFDLQRQDLAGLETLEAPFEDRLPVKGEITGNVAITGQKINLRREQLKGDNECQLQSFLCHPIRDPEGVIVGVISLANKDIAMAKQQGNEGSDHDQSFTNNDERFVEAFAVFCGMAIRNAADFERAVVSEAKLQVAFEVMNFQATSHAEDASNLARLPVPAASSSRIDSFDFNYLNMDDNATLTATIRIFIDLGLQKRFSIDHSTLCRWLLTVKRNYRNETVQYHNWYHAFNVTQMMFCMLLQSKWNSSFSMIDILGLIVACISHDLDHRGTNNSFQHKMNNPLAKLYSTSTLERHHLNQCLLVLTLKGNRILDNLSKDEYAETLSVIERSILATDLALHFRDAPALSALAQQINQSDDNFARLIMENDANRQLLQAGMMTAADLGNATKPWVVHRHVSQLIAEEFWTQGDIERREFNIEPQPMFDRSADLHLVQMDFLANPCLPLYEDMAKFSNAMRPLLEGCMANRHRWASPNEKESSREAEEDMRNL